MSQRQILYKKDSKIRLKLSPFPFVNRKIEEHMNYSFALLDKPRGPTSHEVAAWIKKEFNIPVTHSGTLEIDGEIPLFQGYY
ncbi:MAG TPA: hypothetical protein VKU94_04895 [Geobacterales bacterium]|nr:hypothetical protein [Geobacterales bacterium]